MKSRQLLSVVFSLIMFTGVTAGNAAFADTHDDLIEDFKDCVEAGGTLDDNLIECTLDGVIFVNDEDDTDDDVIEDFEDCVKAGYPIMESFPEQCMTDDGQTFTNTDDDDDDENEDEFRKSHEDMREKLAEYCEMSDEDKAAFVAEHDKSEDHIDDMNQYCELDENGRIDFIKQHQDEYKAHMKDQMMDKEHRMDYERLCALDETERAAEIDDAEKFTTISEWCEMTPEERDDYKKESHDSNKSHDFDGMSDAGKDHMSDTAKDRHEELREKFSEQSERIKSMIMDKRDISDERHDEIRMKYEEKFGEDSDKKRTEIKMKYKDHMLKMKFEMSEERKSDVHERVAEMKAYKAELREQTSQITDEEKQQLREEFIEQAKDMQLVWISPRTQMTAGIDAGDVECREGFSLVMKVSNGVAMCLKADSALKMIDRGIIVPAN